MQCVRMKQNAGVSQRILTWRNVFKNAQQERLKKQLETLQRSTMPL